MTRLTEVVRGLLRGERSGIARDHAVNLDRRTLRVRRARRTPSACRRSPRAQARPRRRIRPPAAGAVELPSPRWAGLCEGAVADVARRPCATLPPRRTPAGVRARCLACVPGDIFAAVAGEASMSQRVLSTVRLLSEKRYDVHQLRPRCSGSAVTRSGTQRAHVSIYGLKPADWCGACGCSGEQRSVPCTRDRFARSDRTRRRGLAAKSAPGVSGSVVVDPFAGSGNTLYWITRRVAAGAERGLRARRCRVRADARELVDHGPGNRRSARGLRARPAGAERLGCRPGDRVRIAAVGRRAR